MALELRQSVCLAEQRVASKRGGRCGQSSIEALLIKLFAGEPPVELAGELAAELDELCVELDERFADLLIGPFAEMTGSLLGSRILFAVLASLAKQSFAVSASCLLVLCWLVAFCLTNSLSVLPEGALLSVSFSLCSLLAGFASPCNSPLE